MSIKSALRQSAKVSNATYGASAECSGTVLTTVEMENVQSMLRQKLFRAKKYWKRKTIKKFDTAYRKSFRFPSFALFCTKYLSLLVGRLFGAHPFEGLAAKN